MRNVLILFALILGVSCTQQAKPVAIEEVSLGVTIESDYPEMLSEWKFFMGERMDAQVKPYEINSPLFSDYAHKERFVFLPEGTKMKYHPEEVFDFPLGAVLIKNFFYPVDFKDPLGDRRMMETRLLIKEEKEWAAIVYQWNEKQTDATLVLLGAEVPVEWIDLSGQIQAINYSIPSQPQCKSCHDMNGNITPIGPSARQLNQHKQLISWSENGFLEGLPDANIPALVDYQNPNVSLNDRARAWLEINCAHCHRREGPAKNSGLYLLASQTDPYRIGVNKPPIAAGKGSGGMKYSIVPGDPDQSILVHRITSLEPGEMMPELGRKLNHAEGIQLIRDWIAEMN